MVETIFTSNLVVETILPFLLIFTIVFAILEKSKILGDGKRQIDAIVALAIGLLFIAFGSATDIVVRMIPFLYGDNTGLLINGFFIIVVVVAIIAVVVGGKEKKDDKKS